MRIPYCVKLFVSIVALSFFYSCGKETKIPAANSTQDTGTAQVTTTTSTTTTVGTTNTTTPTSSEPCCKTENVIIIVIDGPRYSETWGDYTRQNIPNLYRLQYEGVRLDSFNNMGTTNTDSGHDAICTGNYENLENTGQVLPQYSSIFQNYLKSTGKPAEKAWVIASKDKLQILGNCQEEGWAGKYMPRTDCGNAGLFTGYRSDDTTLIRAKNVLTTYHPNLMLINFKDPDYYGHGMQWDNYINAIKETDAYVKELYDLIQSDDTYKNKTTIIVTNDHGRHLPGVADGYVSHGDGCDGCRHIEFLGIGPDFKVGAALGTPYEQIDISKTVAKLLNFNMETSKGKVMTQLFK
jgi:hypothetical protein